jgi:hypothetical protein
MIRFPWNPTAVYPRSNLEQTQEHQGIQQHIQDGGGQQQAKKILQPTLRVYYLCTKNKIGGENRWIKTTQATSEPVRKITLSSASVKTIARIVQSSSSRIG